MADGAKPLETTRDTSACGGDGETRPRPLAERQIEALEELVGIGLKLARAIERRVDEATAGPPPLADLNAAAIAYARVARAVRQSILLQDRLKAGRDAATAKAADLRSRVAGIVGRAIEDEHAEAEQVERLAAEAAEGLEQERFGDVLARPIRQIVADICMDLGLAPDWRGLESEIAAAEAFARGDADAEASSEDLSGPIKVYWLGSDGRPMPAPEPRYMRNRRKRPGESAEDPEPRRDSS